MLGHAQVGRDAGPDDDERGEDPEQECGLAYGKPRKLLALQEEPNPTGTTAMNVELDNFAAYRCGGIGCRLPFTVAVENRPPGRSRARHRPSVARGTRCAVRPKRSFA